MDVQVWLGTFSTESALRAYLDETYDDDDDEVPISAFAADQGETYYDHDWLASRFDRDVGLEGLVATGFAPATAQALISSARGVEVREANTLITMGVEESGIDSPRSCRSTGYELHYLGTFAAEW